MIKNLIQGDRLILKSIPVTGLSYSTGAEAYFIKYEENSDLFISLDTSGKKAFIIPYRAVIKAYDHLTGAIKYERDPACAI